MANAYLATKMDIYLTNYNEDEAAAAAAAAAARQLEGGKSGISDDISDSSSRQLDLESHNNVDDNANGDRNLSPTVLLEEDSNLGNDDDQMGFNIDDQKPINSGNGNINHLHHLNRNFVEEPELFDDDSYQKPNGKTGIASWYREPGWMIRKLMEWRSVRPIYKHVGLQRRRDLYGKKARRLKERLSLSEGEISSSSISSNERNKARVGKCCITKCLIFVSTYFGTDFHVPSTVELAVKFFVNIPLQNPVKLSSNSVIFRQISAKFCQNCVSFFVEIRRQNSSSKFRQSPFNFR